MAVSSSRAGAARASRQSRSRPTAALTAALALAALLWPAAAQAHGLVGRAFLPVPAWLFAWAAGAVLVISFLALPRLWSVPRLECVEAWRLIGLPPLAEPLAGAAGVAGLVAVVVCGIGGNQVPTANLAPTAVFVLFWIAIPVLSAVLGDIFRAVNPWRAVARAVSLLARRTGLARRVGPPLPYPSRLGRWPAVAGIIGFGWLELAFVGREHPATLAVLATGYALVQLTGMAFYGIEPWSANADGFGVAFNLFSRLAAVEYHDRAIWRRPLLSGLAGLAPAPGTVALLSAMIGTTTFDGFVNGPVWRSLAPSLARWWRDLGLGGTAALELTLTLGLLVCVALCGGLYRLGVRGMSSSTREPHRGLAGAFAHSLGPIAFGYLLAHYFSLLVTQGQATASLISDPMGTGANIFGTAGTRIDYGLFSAALIWYVQVAALVGGHVSGLALAHDRALAVYDELDDAVVSQRWMLVVMVSFTCLGLWLLSAVNT